MSTYEEFMVLLTIGLLIVAILNSTWNLAAVRHRNQQKTAQCYQHRTVFDRYLKMIPNSQAYCIIFRNSLQAKIRWLLFLYAKGE